MDAFPALDLVSEYAAALAHQDSDRMNALRSPDFVLDFVHGDAFEDKPLSGRQTEEFWPSWFAAFPEMDIEVTRTIVAEEVVVMQWVFTGTNSGPLQPPIFDGTVEPTGRTVRLRGVSIYDVADGLLRRETMYIDLATVMVELGVEL